MLYIILKEENMSEKHKSCLTIEDIRQKITEINPGAVVLTEKYINNSQQLDIVCSDCGRIFQKTWSTIQRKRTCKCRSCSRKDGWKNCRRETEYQEKFKKEFLQYGLVVLEEPIFAREKYLCKNNKGFLGKISLENARLGKQFSIFSPAFNEENFLYNVNQFFKNNNVDCEALSYRKRKPSWSSKVCCRCKCGNTFYGNLADIIQNNKWRCESCASVKSSLEIKVEKVLKDLNIDFVSQKRFNDCRSGITNYLLPFDFYIEKYRVCIEVDGEQHFKLSKFGNQTEEEALESFKKRQYNDSIKTEYCKNHGLILLRIDYKKFRGREEYKEILEKFFQSFLCNNK